MTDTPRYLDGFLAAVRPGHDRQPPPEPPAPPAATEELSWEERIKRGLHPLDSFTRLLDYAGTNRVPDSDDQFRFRWFGLFYQAPRQDAFLLRLRLPGERLRAFQLVGLAEITQEHAGGQIVLNPQGGLDIPGVSVRAAVEILRATEAIGLSARQTGGDAVQAVRGGGDDGLVADGPRTPFGPLVGAWEQVLKYDRALADLPRGCEVVFQRPDESPGTGPEGEHDTVLLREMPGADAPTFLLAVHGGPEGGFLLPASHIVSGGVRLLQAWAAGADRSDRASAGLAPFCHALGRERMSALLGDAPWQPWPTKPETGSARPTPGLAIPGGRLLSGQLSLLGQILREHGLEEIRLFRACLHLARPVGDDAKSALDLALGTG